MTTSMQLTLLWYAGSWASPGLVSIRSNIIENEDRCMGLAGGASVNTHVLFYTHSCISSLSSSHFTTSPFTAHSLHFTFFLVSFPPFPVVMFCILHCSGSTYYGAFSGPFPIGSGPIAMDNVQCEGTELNLLDCPYTTNHNCLHVEDVGIMCSIEGRWLAACTCALPFPT